MFSLIGLYHITRFTIKNIFVRILHQYKLFLMFTVIIELILIRQIERKNVTLRPNAIPHLFDGLPSYLSNPSSGYLPSPTKRRKIGYGTARPCPEIRVDADLIGSYDVISGSASDHLATSFPLLLIKPCSYTIIMYGMRHIEDKYSAVMLLSTLSHDPC